jgi:hypothetical protein
MRRSRQLLGVACLAMLAACSGGSPSATPKTTSTTGRTRTTTPSVPACSPSTVTASIDFTKFGGTSSTLAGAVRFSNTSSASCSIRGVPQVQVFGAGGQAMSIFEVASTPSVVPTAVLTPTTGGGGTQGASSITFSSWTCATDTMSLTVRFTGWASSIPASPDSTSGTNTSTPCIPSTETGQTVYMGPVISVAPIAG